MRSRSTTIIENVAVDVVVVVVLVVVVVVVVVVLVVVAAVLAVVVAAAAVAVVVVVVSDTTFHPKQLTPFHTSMDEVITPSRKICGRKKQQLEATPESFHIYPG